LDCILNDNLDNVIDNVDGVLIATPNHTHYPVAEAALRKGVPVLIEKPITTTYGDAIRLCELAGIITPLFLLDIEPAISPVCS
jgi:predicted dehydrogenase